MKAVKLKTETVLACLEAIVPEEDEDDRKAIRAAIVDLTAVMEKHGVYGEAAIIILRATIGG